MADRFWRKGNDRRAVRERTALLPRGTRYITWVHHDPWCSYINDEGPCDCHPEVDLLILAWPGDERLLGKRQGAERGKL